MACGTWKLIVGKLLTVVEPGGWLDATSDRIIIKLQVIVARLASCSRIQNMDDIH